VGGTAPGVTIRAISAKASGFYVELLANETAVFSDGMRPWNMSSKSHMAEPRKNGLLKSGRMLMELMAEFERSICGGSGRNEY
jgi:hypothetical protein